MRNAIINGPICDHYVTYSNTLCAIIFECVSGCTVGACEHLHLGCTVHCTALTVRGGHFSTGYNIKTFPIIELILGKTYLCQVKLYLMHCFLYNLRAKS